MKNKVNGFYVHLHKNGSYACSIQLVESVGRGFKNSKEIAKALQERGLTEMLGFETLEDMEQSIQGVIEDKLI